VGYDAGVGLGLPNTKPTISKARLYTCFSYENRHHHRAEVYKPIMQYAEPGSLFRWHLAQVLTRRGLRNTSNSRRIAARSRNPKSLDLTEFSPGKPRTVLSSPTPTRSRISMRLERLVQGQRTFQRRDLPLN